MATHAMPLYICDGHIVYLSRNSCLSRELSRQFMLMMLFYYYKIIKHWRCATGRHASYEEIFPIKSSLGFDNKTLNHFSQKHLLIKIPAFTYEKNACYSECYGIVMLPRKVEYYVMQNTNGPSAKSYVLKVPTIF